MCIELKIIEQQLELLKERPAELEKVELMIQRARLKNQFGLSDKEIKRDLARIEKRLNKSKLFKTM